VSVSVTKGHDLRARAEKRLGESKRKRKLVPDVDSLIHELEVHQVELEIQNEELRAARHELEVGLERYTELFDFAPIGYALVGRDGVIKNVNHAGARLLGRPRRALVGIYLATRVSHHSLGALAELVEHTLSSGHARGELQIVGRDDLLAGETTLRVNGAAVLRDGERILLAFEDVTTERAKERQLERTEAALREADRRKNEFLAVLSHELRNPLAAVRNSLFVLGHASATEDAVRAAHSTIDRQVTHLTRLIDDLLDVTRISRGKIQLKRERVDLGELVCRAIEDHRAGFEVRGIQLAYAGPDRPVWIDADPARIVQVISNLLTNAEKFTSRHGHVKVTIGHEGELALVRVRDDGTGIAPHLLPHLFAPFAQGPQGPERQHGGLGLGLAMVKWLVELHGGSARIASTGPGYGTEVTLTLPVASAPARTAPATAASGARRKRVLIVEDNPDGAESLKDALVLGGHTVELAMDGPTAVRIAHATQPDVMICDIGLPGMDGYAVARAIRRSPTLSGTFLVALSGYAQPEDVQRASEAGFDRHLAKPTSLAVIEQVIADAKGRSS
jgi:two-component system CheB/CheR fusion protein